MVGRLTTSVEQDILLDRVATTKTTVEVESSAAQVEDDVPAQNTLRGLGLEEGAALLLPHTDLVEQVVLHSGVPNNAIPDESTKVQKYKSTKVPKYKSTKVQKYKSTKVPKYRSTTAQKYVSRMYVSTQVPKYWYLSMAPQ